MRVRSAGHAEAAAPADVAEARGRVRGLDADGHDPARGRRLDGLPHRVLEDLHRGDHLIRRERSHDRVRVAQGEDRRGQADGGRGVLRRGLEHQIRLRQGRQLRAHRLPVGLPGHHEHARGQGRQTVPRGTDQGLTRAGEVVEELRRGGPREGPQAGAHAPGGDHGVEAGQGRARRGLARGIGQVRIGAHRARLRNRPDGGPLDASQAGHSPDRTGRRRGAARVTVVARVPDRARRRGKGLP